MSTATHTHTLPPDYLQDHEHGEALDDEVPQDLQPRDDSGWTAPLLWWRLDHQGSPRQSGAAEGAIRQ